MKDVYHEEPHKTCKMKLNLPLEFINDVNKDLFKPIEMSGVLNFDNNDNVTSIDKNKGDKDSVSTPNNVINYHTHPISAYNEGETIWGWPSGEDIRETIKFALSGNKAHLVFTVEGLYTIQVNPCKLKKMKELLNDQERGVLIFIIEEYFKTTHNFRGIEEVNNLNLNKRRRFNMNPYSYIDYVNTFDLKNLNSTNVIFHKKNHNKKVSKTGHTGINSKEHDNLHKYYGSAAEESFTKIPNIGFPEMEDDYITNLPLKKYIQAEDLKDSMFYISENGNEVKPLKLKPAKLVSIFNKILKKFNTKPCNNEWNTSSNSWFYMNLFPTLAYQTKAYKSGNRYISPHAQYLMDRQLLVIKNTPFIRIFSDDREGCTVNDIGKTNHFKVGKSISNVQRYSVGNYTFGMSDMEYQKIIINYLIGTKKVKSITELNRELRKISQR